MGGASTATARSSCGLKMKPRLVASICANLVTRARRRPISTLRRARCVSFGRLVWNAHAIKDSLSASPGHASASARANAQPATTGIDHQRIRGQERRNFIEAQRLLAIGVEASGGGTIKRRPCERRPRDVDMQ